MSTPDEIAAGLKRAADELGGPKKLIQKVVYLVQRHVQKRTRVLTGHLRRSITSRVLTAERGVVGSNVVYLRYQKNRPLEEGLDNAMPEVGARLHGYGIRDVLGKVTG